MEYPIPKRLINGEYTFQNPDGTLWSKLYGAKFIFKEAYKFVDGMARVKLKNDTITFVSTNRKFLKLPLFEKILGASDFSEGYAAIVTKKGCTYVDKNGRYIKGAPMFDAVYDFHDGFAKVLSHAKGGYTYIGKRGQVLKRMLYECGEYHEGFAWVKYTLGIGEADDENYSYYDSDGNIIANSFVKAFDFCEGFGRVQTPSGWTFMDKNCQVLNAAFKSAEDFKNCLAKVVTQNDEVKYLDKFFGIWSQEIGEELQKIYDQPNYIFEIKDKIGSNRHLLKIALAIIKKKIVDTKDNFSPDRYKEKIDDINKKIVETFPELIKELKDEKRVNTKDEDLER